MKYKLTAFCLALLAASFLAAPTALADGINFNTSLGEGVYMGSGISNTDWTTLTSGPLELGLTAYLSGPSGGPVVSSDGTYTFALGAAVDIGFSVDTDLGLAAGGSTLGNGVATITITNDNNNESYAFNPATLLPDNAYMASDGSVVCNATADCAYNPAYIGMQNAEKPTFAFIADQIGLNTSIPTNLTVTEAWNASVDPQLSIGLDFVGATAPTPEPASIGAIMGGLMFAGILVVRRRQACQLIAK